MQSNTVETLIGAVVVVVAAAFLFFAYTTTSAGSISGYEINARFGSVEGISVGTDVRMRGIKIGTVSALKLDTRSYTALARLSIGKDIPIPQDSSAKITSAGLLGSSYISIAPGGSDDMLKPGAILQNTQGAVDLMGLVGRFINSGSGSSQPGNNHSAPKPASPLPEVP